MALTERTEIGKREVLVDGQIQVRMDTVVARDGVEIARTYSRYVLAPGDSLVNVNPLVVRVAQAEWTPAVLAAYKAKLGEKG